MPHIDSGWAKVMVTIIPIVIALIFNYASMNNSIGNLSYRIDRLEQAERHYSAKEDAQDAKINALDKQGAVMMAILRRLERKIDQLVQDVKELKNSKGRNNGNNRRR